MYINTDEKCKLKKAVEDGDLEAVKESLQSFVPISGLGKSPKRPKKHFTFIDLTDLERYCLLEKAIYKNHREIVRFLLSEGFEVNNSEILGWRTPLIHQAARKANLEIVAMLIEQGVDLDSMEEHGYTPLHEAVKKNAEEVVKLLLGHGADANILSVHGSPLHEAIRMDSVELVKILLQNGADLNLESSYYQITPLEETIKKEKTKVLEAILDAGIDITQGITEDMKKPLIYAASSGSISVLMLLLDRGFDVNVSDRTGDTALHAAIENGHNNVCDFLLSHGANVNAKESYTSPLQVAAKLGKVGFVEKLLTLGAKVDHQDSEHRTALHLGVKSGDIETVELLLKQKANRKTLDFYGLSPFDEAAKLGHLKIMELLLNSKNFVREKVMISERLLNSALNYAAEYGHAIIVQLLLKSGATLKSSGDCEWYEESYVLHMAARKGHDQVITTLLDFKADINAEDSGSMTPLESAAMYAQVSTMKLLIERGASVVRDSITPLHYAAQSESKEAIRFLLHQGININSKDSTGRTPLFYAKDFPETILYLVQLGADLNAADNDGTTVVQYYFEKGCRKSYRAIVKLVAKLKSNNVQSSEAVVKYIENNFDLSCYAYDCEQELERMKLIMIEGTDISLHDIFQASELVPYARNNLIVKNFVVAKVTSRLVIYGSMVFSHFNKGLRRKELIDEVKRFFSLLQDDNDEPLPRLANLCTEQILGFLSNEDLMTLKTFLKTKPHE